MISAGYLNALVAAGIVLPGGDTPGVTTWREPGLRMVDLLIGHYTTMLGEAEVVEHGFLMPGQRYREVFPGYSNVHAAGEYVLRPDNMVANVDTLRKRGLRGPLVAIGGLLRQYDGAVRPLFRERYIWPAIQVTQLAPAREAVARLDEHQRVLERLFESIGLPVVSIQVDGLGYGTRCYLTVTCLSDGRPTVLSTAYLMAPGYRDALGVEDEVLDIGFTGKVIAVLAMHHRDHRGLVLPSAVAPVQVGVVRDQNTPDLALRDAGVRAETVIAGKSRFRAERSWHRQGVPLVIGIRENAPPRLARRLPLVRENTDLGLVAKHLRAHDERLRERVAIQLRKTLWDSGLLRGLCDGCAERVPVFGWLTPAAERACHGCSKAGRVALISEGGRFY
jgi:prolyl-tRNA synthetase